MLESISHVLQAKLSELSAQLAFAPAWLVSLIILIVAFAAAWLLHAAIFAALRRLSRGNRRYFRTITEAIKNPARFAALLIAFAIALPTAPLSSETQDILARFLGLATICWVGWIVLTGVHIAANLYLLNFGLDVGDNLLARKHITQVRVMRRALDTVVVLLTLGFALMTFDAVRQYGVSLFASAGAAGVIFGLAARPLFSNLLAGVQLAVSQPIRIDDAVVVENEWGNVEDITFNYVVLRLWDLRRMVVPLSYFIEKPFQNWTRIVGDLIGSVLLYLDHTAPVDAIREKLREIVAQSKLWDGKVVNLQVTDCKETTIELRALISANNASAAWDLRCEVREKLIDFVRREHPYALPRRRNEVVEPSHLKTSGPFPETGSRN